MPEGPQVHRTANLIRGFAGAAIISIQHPKSRTPWEIKLPVTINRVKAVGKNIFVYLSDGSIIYNHMLMWGSWRATCEPIGRKRLNTCFETTRGPLGYFGGGILKIITESQSAEILNRIGPELVASNSAQDAFELVAASKNAIGEALLSQDLIAGIGNIYKSEGLFAARINPARPANQVTTAEYDRLFTFLKPQMVADVKRSGPITTTTAEAKRSGLRNFVYRRFHQPCAFCGTKIERIYQGSPLSRSTYYCPRCQG